MFPAKCILSGSAPFGVAGSLHTLGFGLGLKETSCHCANQEARIIIRLEVALRKWALLIVRCHNSQAPSAMADVEPKAHPLGPLGVFRLEIHKTPSERLTYHLPSGYVVIAGGGPIGLLLARVLSFHGVNSVLFERNESTTK
ncbi:unnamed protein product [Clonostachys byssicola]|uniref:FAD-binding domain-containing protein n=1 Tax=Clonostachys byssicola TaxID=160290 RepID=A0A9N9Y1M0_9HYPO|nr:unnamed protein product [Clonostachys byssicola]